MSRPARTGPTKLIQFKLDADVHEMLRTIAFADKCSMLDFVQDAVRREYAKREKRGAQPWRIVPTEKPDPEELNGRFAIVDATPEVGSGTVTEQQSFEFPDEDIPFLAEGDDLSLSPDEEELIW